MPRAWRAESARRIRIAGGVKLDRVPYRTDTMVLER